MLVELILLFLDKSQTLTNEDKTIVYSVLKNNNDGIFRFTKIDCWASFKKLDGNEPTVLSD